MSEISVINRSERPITIEVLVSDLRALGVREGSALLVHSSLRSLGWVCGGPVAVVDALTASITKTGTLVMPTHSPQLSDPANWTNPPVPSHWWSSIRESMPPYDPVATPTTGMGAISETFRRMRRVVRSNHPTGSFAARGHHAEEVVRDHVLEDPFGEQSPLGKLHELGADVLLLGVGHSSNSSLHLAERLAFGSQQVRLETGAPVVVGDGRRWVAYSEPDVDATDFRSLGESYAATPEPLAEGRVGLAKALLIPQRDLVRFGVKWLRSNRDRSGRPTSH